MATTVTVKGQVTIPKKVREAAGIRPGDRVEVRARAGGGVIVERQAPPDARSKAGKRVDMAVAELRRQGVKPPKSTDQLMRMLRGDD
jgi:antitoxin PrlF